MVIIRAHFCHHLVGIDDILIRFCPIHGQLLDDSGEMRRVLEVTDEGHGLLGGLSDQPHSILIHFLKFL